MQPTLSTAAAVHEWTSSERGVTEIVRICCHNTDRCTSAGPAVPCDKYDETKDRKLERIVGRSPDTQTACNRYGFSHVPAIHNFC